jgi:hypothetical protein
VEALAALAAWVALVEVLGAPMGLVGRVVLGSDQAPRAVQEGKAAPW